MSRIHELPSIHTLSSTDAQRYWDKLHPIKVVSHERPLQYGHPVEIPPKLAGTIGRSANLMEEIAIDSIMQQGATTWLGNNAASFAGDSLNIQEINHQLEGRLLQGYRLPISYDGMITVFRGRPHYTVVEAQSLVAHGPWIRSMLQAADKDPDDPSSWQGKENPTLVVQQMKDNFAKGEVITVLDTTPLSGPFIHEQVGLAKALGTSGSVPISALDIQFNPEIGYFHYGYAVDTRGYPIPNGNGFLRTSDRIPIRHVLSRMTQPDLDHLYNLVRGNPQQSELILKFLRDEKINWIWHPAWQSLIDKSRLPYICKKLEERQENVTRNQFVPIFVAGETPPLGTYVRKPVSSVQGEGVTIVQVNGVPQQVEEGTVYQKYFYPYPFSIPLDAEIARQFPVTPHAPRNVASGFQEHFGWGQTTTPASLELCYMVPPWCKGELTGYFIGRVAPRYTGPDSRNITQTNLSKAQAAMYEYIRDQDHWKTPFGFSPVTLQKT